MASDAMPMLGAPSALVTEARLWQVTQEIQAQLAALRAASVHLRVGTVAVPALNASAYTDLSLTWSTGGPFPDTAYEALPALTTNVASLLGKVSCSVTAKSTTGCTVRVMNTGLLAISTGASVLVVALREGLDA